jgi:outer membrane protein OmpU
MNKLKMLGLSALAGSLAATSAYAGEMSVSGSAKATYTNRDASGSLASRDVTGNNFGFNKLLSFNGSGDVDMGTVSVFFGNNGTSQSSANMSLDMGDMGSLTLDNGVGGHGIGSIDDKTPTANEEIWDNISYGTGHDGFRVGIGNAGAIAYANTFGGVSVSADYVKQGGGSLEDGATGAGGSGSGKSIAISASPVDGLGIGVGVGDAGTANASIDSDQETAYVTYAMGGFTAGYQIAEETTSGAGDWETTQWGVSFNINDSMAVGYGERTTEFPADGDNATTLVDEESQGISASYTAGSMSIKANMNEVENMKGASKDNTETLEVALTFAF